MKTTTKDICDTSFYGITIKASLTQLIRWIGNPIYKGNNGKNKINFEWEMETESGNVFTVHDWKEYRIIPADEIIEWHIGGETCGASEEALYEIRIKKTADEFGCSIKSAKNIVNMLIWMTENEIVLKSLWYEYKTETKSDILFDEFCYGMWPACKKNYKKTQEI